MATFIFMLTPDADPDDFELLREKLQTKFPHHKFVSNVEEFKDVENNIMAVSEAAPVDGHVGMIKMPDSLEVQRVKEAFFALLDE